MESRSQMKFLRLLLAWLVAAVVTAALGSIIQTQFNLAAIAALGAPIPVGARLHTTLQDLAGFAPMFGLVGAAGFVPGFMVAALLSWRRPQWRAVLYPLAGAAALVTAVLLMNALLPVTPIGATRSAWGIAALGLAGLAGGAAFAALAPRSKRARNMA
jgi:hypothetical protein